MVDAADRALRIAVVGHTNTGKTSLLRTLTRDRRFGEVSFRPGTTRHVEVARLLVGSQAVLELYDTPGMEEPIALLALLESLPPQADSRQDGPSRIAQFLETPEAGGQFEQEAKVLRQMLKSDAAFYVVDARDPVLSKYRDEISLLGSCGIPLLPLLNFVADPAANEQAWREVFSRSGLHAVVRFDTVAPERGSERLLYEKLTTLLDPYRQRLQDIIQSHEEDARHRHRAAIRLIAELLVDVAAFRLRVMSDTQTALEAGVEALNDAVRGREEACLRTLLDLYSFSEDDVQQSGVAITDGQWEHDLFDPETLQLMGIRIGGGAAAGAATGLGIDMMVGGLTLGAAAAIGALAGGGWQTLRHYGNRLLSSISGEHALRVQDDILQALAVRQLNLLYRLQGRGHAARTPMARETVEQVGKDRNTALLWPGGLPEALRQARSRPEWSLLQPDASEQSARREAVTTLEAELQSAYELRIKT